ncbi:MAG: hypothetical protein R3B99_25965 [Polyangiales bacterium]
MALDERNELDEAPESKDALATTAFGSETPSDRVAVQALAPVETGPSGLAADSVGGFAGAARSEPRRIVLDDDEDEGPDPMIGQVLSGLYKVHSRIGRGGMGTVYMAVHIHLDKPFAVKVLSDQIAANKSAVQRLHQGGPRRRARSTTATSSTYCSGFDAMEETGASSS